MPKIDESAISLLHDIADAAVCLVLNDSKGRNTGHDRSRSPFSSRRRHEGDRVSQFFIT